MINKKALGFTECLMHTCAVGGADDLEKSLFELVV